MKHKNEMGKILIKYGLVLTFLFSCNNSDIITKSEKEWLKQHPNLVVGLSPNAPPYQFVNEKGVEVGIFIDFLTIIEAKLDYKFKKVYHSDFSKLLTDTKNGNVDVLLEVQETDERKEFLNFTPYLISHNHIIVVKKSEKDIGNIIDLKTKNITVVNKYAIQEYLSKNYPDYKILPLLDDVACLRAVSTGQADVFICQQAVATYYIEKEGISNLKIVGEIDYSNKLAIASRKNLDTLHTILTKAVNSITKTEKQNIDSNWLSYEVKPFYLKASFWIVIVLIFLVVIFIIGLFSLVLQKRVKQKTSELRIAKERAEENGFLIRKQYQELQSAEEEIRASNEELIVTADALKISNEELLNAKEEAEEKYEQVNDLEQRLQFALEASNTGAWDLDLIDHSAIRTLQHDKIFGYETLLPQWTYEIFISHVLDCHKQQVNEKFNYAVQSKSDWSFECQILTVKNETRWIWAGGQHTLDEKGNIHRMAGIVQDITEKKLAEQELIKTQILLKSSLESPKDMIILSIDNNYNYLYFNEFHKVSMKYAYNKDVSIGMNILDCITDNSDKEKSLINYGKALQGISHSTIEVFGDTNKSYYESFYNPIYNEKNEIIGTTAFARDITDRKRAEIALQQNEEKFSIMFRKAPFAAALSGISDFKFVEVNEQFEKLWGYSNAEVIGKTTSELGLYPDINERARLSAIFREKGFIHDEETKMITKTGQLMDALVSSDIVKIGNEQFLLSTVQNITERKQAELLLQEKNNEIEAQNEEYKQINNELYVAKERAEESDRLKTAFLQNMSHEIRTPMNAIMGFSEMLVNNFNDKPKLEKFTGIITQRCNDLLDIINDLLDIAKIESGQLAVSIEKCNLNTIFAELTIFFKEYQKRIGKEHISFSLHAQCDTKNAFIATDKGKLKQIFINLINNAFKFTEKGTIEGGCKFDTSGNFIFYVTDTGIGIQPEKQQMIFERFTQVEQSGNRLYGGTGLGLSIARGMVGLLGGEISVESQFGKGSTFSFTIPYKTAVELANEPLVLQEITGHKFLNKTVLVVEDDLFNAEYLKEILSEVGLNILHTTLGEEAVQILLAQPVDLILMDIRLPDMDGYEATHQIRQHKPHLKIIAQTAYASHADKQQAIDAGCNDYISKPTKPEVLMAMINKHLFE